MGMTMRKIILRIQRRALGPPRNVEKLKRSRRRKLFYVLY